MLKRLCIALAAIAAVSCGKNPQSLLDAVIMEKNFIPYKLPMSDTRVGTVLRGNNEEMYLVARPELCFPDLNGNDSLRWVQQTDIPAQYKRVEFGFNAGLNPVLGVGNQLLTFKASASYAKTVQMEFKAATVEFLNESSFRRHYEQGMSPECKDLLSQYAFIGQGLRIESMSFTFRDAAGGNIDLTTKLNELVSFSANVRWYIENSYTLVIETPKYIGYRMGRLARAEGEEGRWYIAYASSVDKDGNWQFRNVDESANKPSFVAPAATYVAEPLLP